MAKSKKPNPFVKDMKKEKKPVAAKPGNKKMDMKAMKRGKY